MENSTFISPVPRNQEISGLAPPPAGGPAPTITPNTMPDVPTITVPVTALYDTGVNPLVISPTAPSMMVLVKNNEAVSILVKTVAPGDPGIILPSGAKYLFGVDESNPPGNLLLLGGNSATTGNVNIIANVAAISAAPTASGIGFLLGYYTRNDGGGGTLIWSPASLATVDNGLVFFGNGNVNPIVAGRWLRQIEGGSLDVRAFGAKFDPVTPIDDSAAWNTAMDSLAGKGIDLIGENGVSVIQHPLHPPKTNLAAGDAPRGLTVRLSDACEIRSRIVSGGSNSDSIFFAAYTPGPSAGLVNSVARGDKTIRVDAGVFAQGDKIAIEGPAGNTQYGNIRTVKLVTPVGPNFDLLLDRPVTQKFNTADVIGPPTVTRVDEQLMNFHLIGGLITGSGTRMWECLAGESVTVERTFFDDRQGLINAGGYLCSFDVGSYRCGYIDTRASSANALAMLVQESTEMCFQIRSSAFGNASALGSYSGHCFCDCTDPYVEDCDAYECVAGLAFTTNGNIETSCQDAKVKGGRFYDNTYGIEVQGACDNTQIDGADCSYNNTEGIWLTGGAIPASGIVYAAFSRNTKITGSTLKKNAANGLKIDVGVKGTKVGQATVSENGAFGIGALDDMDIDQIRGDANVGGDVFFGGSNSRIEQFEFHNSSVGFASLQCGGVDGSVVYVERGSILATGGGGASFGIVTSGFGTAVYVRDIRFSAGTGIFLNPTDTLWWGDGVDLDGCVLQINNVAGSFLSFMNVAANGAGTPQAIPFPKIRVFQQVRMRLDTILGAPGFVPQITVNAGVGFTFTAAVGDTSIYRADIAL